jgi:hypothetical protein
VWREYKPLQVVYREDQGAALVSGRRNAGWRPGGDLERVVLIALQTLPAQQMNPHIKQLQGKALHLPCAAARRLHLLARGCWK